MQLATILLLPALAAATAFPTLETRATDAENLATCERKNPQLLDAIHNFCTENNHITVPSDYGRNGKTVGNNVAWIWPEAGCPTSWVPMNYCKSQFHSLCAAGDKNGYGAAWFGYPDTCQVFLLNDKAVHEYESTHGP